MLRAVEDKWTVEDKCSGLSKDTVLLINSCALLDYSIINSQHWEEKGYSVYGSGALIPHCILLIDLIRANRHDHLVDAFVKHKQLLLRVISPHVQIRDSGSFWWCWAFRVRRSVSSSPVNGSCYERHCSDDGHGAPSWHVADDTLLQNTTGHHEHGKTLPESKTQSPTQTLQDLIILVLQKWSQKSSKRHYIQRTLPFCAALSWDTLYLHNTHSAKSCFCSHELNISTANIESSCICIFTGRSLPIKKKIKNSTSCKTKPFWPQQSPKKKKNREIL